MRMKIKRIVLVFFLLLIIPFFGCQTKKDVLVFTSYESYQPINSNQEFRGVFVCTVYGMDYPSSYTKNPDVLTKDIDDIVIKAFNYGFNAVIFQARPSSDAFYKSSIFPWSKYLTGTQGQAPSGGFDPLEYIIKKCHEVNLELHAWINPYRVTALTSDKLISGHIAMQNSEYTVNYEGKLYFNPGIPDVRKIITAGAKEIVKNYNVDGIHFDDYFYPGKNFDDNDTYLKYNKDFLNIEDWRRNNNDLLIQETYNAIKQINPAVKFGISPSGIWANKAYNSLGSQTNGFQSYYEIFADSRKWAKENFIDYIAPQIYWNIGNSAADYLVLANWWAEVVKGTDVKLYIAMAAYKADDVAYGAVWQGGAEIERQILINRNIENISGMVFFRFFDVINKPGIQQQLTKYFIFDEFMPDAEIPEILNPQNQNEQPENQRQEGNEPQHENERQYENEQQEINEKGADFFKENNGKNTDSINKAANLITTAIVFLALMSITALVVIILLNKRRFKFKIRK